MAVADELSRPSATAPAYDRQPPQDVAAEQSVLGGMLLSKDAIADVVEVLAGPDFYRPAHQVIYDCILDLYGRGEPADAITVAKWCLTVADRAMSRPSVLLPTPGRAAMTTICPAWRPFVSSSRSRMPVGTPRLTPPREAIASSSSIVGCRTSSRRE